MKSVDSRYALIAACMMHVEGYYSIRSEAWRNNNPGNIEHPNGTMIHYDTKLEGFEALCDDIAANKGKALSKFIAKYAPPTETDNSR